MTDSRSHSETIRASLKRRNAAERRFRFYGMLAISFAVACLGILFFTILSKGISAFQQTYIQIDIHFDSEQQIQKTYRCQLSRIGKEKSPWIVPRGKVAAR